MKWLCQLKDGYMLGVEKGYVKKVHTGYPYPDIEGGQVNAISKYLEKNCSVDLFSFVNEALLLDYPMSEVNFKCHFKSSSMFLESDYSVFMELANEMSKVKLREKPSRNLLLNIRASEVCVEEMDDLGKLRDYFLDGDKEPSIYQPSSSNFSILQYSDFTVSKKGGVLYIRGFHDDIIKLQDFINKCYLGVDYTENRGMKRDLLILSVENGQDVLFFGESLDSSKVYEFVTSLSDKTVKCKRKTGYYVLVSDEYNIILEFKSFKLYRLNTENGNWELVKDRGIF